MYTQVNIVIDTRHDLQIKYQFNQFKYNKYQFNDNIDVEES